VNNPKSEFEMATDLASSSTSSSPAVLKIVIDLDEYHRLLDKKEHLDRQEKKLKEQLEASVIKNENSLENIQTGSGTEEDSDLKTIDHGHLESILKSFEEKFEEKLNRRYGFQPLPQQPSTVQSGGGSLDTFPPTLGQCHNEK
jgi:DNA anti-recombination protein RmuC